MASMASVAHGPRTETSTDDTGSVPGAASATASTPLEALRAVVLGAAAELAGDPSTAAEDQAGSAAGGGGGGGHASISLERPRQAQVGHYSTNAPPLLPPSSGAPPRGVAARLARPLPAPLRSTPL